MLTTDNFSNSRIGYVNAEELIYTFETILRQTPFSECINDILKEVIYFKIYENHAIPGLKATIESTTVAIIKTVNMLSSYKLIKEDADLSCWISPAKRLLDNLLSELVINEWGYYHVDIHQSFISISYLGDHRIMTWSNSEDAKSMNLSSEELLRENSHSFIKPLPRS